jgi:hypothetical protein
MESTSLSSSTHEEEPQPVATIGRRKHVHRPVAPLPENDYAEPQALVFQEYQE